MVSFICSLAFITIGLLEANLSSVVVTHVTQKFSVERTPKYEAENQQINI